MCEHFETVLLLILNVLYIVVHERRGERGKEYVFMAVDK